MIRELGKAAISFIGGSILGTFKTFIDTMTAPVKIWIELLKAMGKWSGIEGGYLLTGALLLSIFVLPVFYGVALGLTGIAAIPAYITAGLIRGALNAVDAFKSNKTVILDPEHHDETGKVSFAKYLWTDNYLTRPFTYLASKLSQFRNRRVALKTEAAQLTKDQVKPKEDGVINNKDITSQIASSQPHVPNQYSNPIEKIPLGKVNLKLQPLFKMNYTEITNAKSGKLDKLQGLRAEIPLRYDSASFRQGIVENEIREHLNKIAKAEKIPLKFKLSIEKNAGHTNLIILPKAGKENTFLENLRKFKAALADTKSENVSNLEAAIGDIIDTIQPKIIGLKEAIMKRAELARIPPALPSSLRTVTPLMTSPTLGAIEISLTNKSDSRITPSVRREQYISWQPQIVDSKWQKRIDYPESFSKILPRKSTEADIKSAIDQCLQQNPIIETEATSMPANLRIIPIGLTEVVNLPVATNNTAQPVKNVALVQKMNDQGTINSQLHFKLGDKPEKTELLKLIHREAEIAFKKLKLLAPDNDQQLTIDIRKSKDPVKQEAYLLYCVYKNYRCVNGDKTLFEPNSPHLEVLNGDKIEREEFLKKYPEIQQLSSETNDQDQIRRQNLVG